MSKIDKFQSGLKFLAGQQKCLVSIAILLLIGREPPIYNCIVGSELPGDRKITI